MFDLILGITADDAKKMIQIEINLLSSDYQITVHNFMVIY